MNLSFGQIRTTQNPRGNTDYKCQQILIIALIENILQRTAVKYCCIDHSAACNH